MVDHARVTVMTFTSPPSLPLSRTWAGWVRGCHCSRSSWFEDHQSPHLFPKIPLSHLDIWQKIWLWAYLPSILHRILELVKLQASCEVTYYDCQSRKRKWNIPAARAEVAYMYRGSTVPLWGSVLKSDVIMMIILLLFLQKQSLAFAVYLFGIGTLLAGLGLKNKAHVMMLSPCLSPDPHPWAGVSA